MSYVLSLDEARVASVDALRADLIQSAAAGQGPTFIAQKLDLLIEKSRRETDGAVLQALRDTIPVIRAWHDMTGELSDSDKATAWHIYSTRSPEMRRITSAIAKAEGRS